MKVKECLKYGDIKYFRLFDYKHALIADYILTAGEMSSLVSYNSLIGEMWANISPLSIDVVDVTIENWLLACLFDYIESIHYTRAFPTIYGGQ